MGQAIPKTRDLWIPWSGGACPVPHGVPYQYLCRMGFGGAPLTTGPCWRWTHTEDPADPEYQYDVIAYRVVPGPKVSS